jgi:hypothetical protein
MWQELTPLSNKALNALFIQKKAPLGKPTALQY